MSDLISLEEILQSFDLFLLLCMFSQIDTTCCCPSPCDSLGKEVVDASKIQVMLCSLLQKEGVTGCEVTEHHQITERLHNVPTQIMERSKNNEGELSDDYR